MQNKIDCFEILCVFSQRNGITFFPLFYGPNLKKVAFFWFCKLEMHFALARFVIIVYKIKISLD